MTTKPYPVAELAILWEREQLSAEQMLGQLLAHVALLQTQILGLQKEQQASLDAKINPIARLPGKVV